MTYSAFELLDAGLQRQLYAMRWDTLRPIQADSIHAYCQTKCDMLLMAETAAGKTEAAFLPILSTITHEPHGSVRALYIGPLKALINDQFGRLEELCKHIDMPVHRWHGDVAQSRKKTLIRQPSGVLLITPESLESLLINRTTHLSRVFGGLRAIVIDELHAFLEGERGLHLRSLLDRLTRYRTSAEPEIRFIGLSATIGDHAIAKRYLSPIAPEAVVVINDADDDTEIMLRVSGYDAAELRPVSGDPDTSEEINDEPLVMRAISEDLVEHCSGQSNLIFANAKGDIELFADMANECCRQLRLRESFLVHHGSLSKEIREDTEAQMKDSRPYTAISSSTLEMGIDIGSVSMVGQIGAPWSVASLKQRMGRSGRRSGEARRLRCYIDTTITVDPSDPTSLLPIELLQTIAICDLMLEGWVEPPRPASLDLSTLTHQIISTIAELGALSAALLFKRLCREGSFTGVTPGVFERLIRALGASDVLEQGPDGAMILGLVGERIRAHYEFYAAFASRREFSVVHGVRLLGTLPMDTLPRVGEFIAFAAARWQVVDIDVDSQRLFVNPASRRKRPQFVSSGGEVHGHVVDRMLAVLRGSDEIAYLNAIGRDALAYARAAASSHHLDSRCILKLSSQKCLWLSWTGTVETRTHAALLSSCGIESDDRKIGLLCQSSDSELRLILDEWRDRVPDLRTLAEHVQPKQRRKYDHLLTNDLLHDGIAAELAWSPLR